MTTNQHDYNLSVERNRSGDIAPALNRLLADTFALYVKSKNFHWHVSGPHFRDYHLLLDEQATQIFTTTDPIAECVRKLGSPTLRSIGDIARLQRIDDSDTAEVAAQDMLSELPKDNRQPSMKCRLAIRCATRRVMWPLPACWKPGSTRPRVAPGSSMRPANRARQRY